MSGALAKQAVRRLLAAPEARFDLDAALAELRALPAQPVIRALLAGLSRPEAGQRWRAVALLGPLVAELAKTAPEAGREVVRRLRWSLNEESGAMGWGAAEAFGEILHHSPLLAGEFAGLLASYLVPCACQLDHPALLAGAVWALGRLAEADPARAASCGAAAHLCDLLAHPDPEVVGRAAWTLGLLDGGPCPERLAALSADVRTASFPCQGRLACASLAELSAAARSRCV
ncbi:MAG: HEAT repeat domain-containing protein [Pseudomonadota bacterium]